MANTIGAQLEAKLEELVNLQRVMDSVAIIGTGLREFQDFQAFVNVVEFVQQTQSELMEEFQGYILRNVAPIVSHINDRV